MGSSSFITYLSNMLTAMDLCKLTIRSSAKSLYSASRLTTSFRSESKSVVKIRTLAPPHYWNMHMMIYS